GRTWLDEVAAEVAGLKERGHEAVATQTPGPTGGLGVGARAAARLVADAEAAAQARRRQQCGVDAAWMRRGRGSLRARSADGGQLRATRCLRANEGTAREWAVLWRLRLSCAS